jgi:hypothetical protein
VGVFLVGACWISWRRTTSVAEVFQSVLGRELGMALPSDLLQAVSAPSGAKIALVVGAGCSVEAPTCVPTGPQCSEEIHRRLLADGVLKNGDCTDPTDLSLVADAVFDKRNSQRDVVERLCERYDLKHASPNDGYLIAAAMLCEGVVSSVVTLNFDLALSNALSELGAGDIVGVIECPEHLARQKAINVYYLHRNVNEKDHELWVLRTAALQHEWKGNWEPIIATKVLAAPVVVFAGLGTPAAVLIASTQLLRNALRAVTKVYQVDLADKAESKFFQQMALDPSAYIQCGWCQFMDQLSKRLQQEQISQLEQAVAEKVRDDRLPDEDVANLLDRLGALGLVKFGKLRGHWLLHHKPYRPVETDDLGLIADLLLALAMTARVSASQVVIIEDGLVEFHRDGRAVAAYLIASGRGHRGRLAVEAAVESRRHQYRSRPVPPSGVIVGGTSNIWTTLPTPPPDLVRGDVSEDIVAGATALPMIHITELRDAPNLVQRVVP